MNFNELSEQEKVEYARLLFTHLESAQEVKNWTFTFLGLELPLEIVDPESSSSPLDAIWQVYNTFKNNSGDKNPGYIMMSCREGMKCSKKGTILITYDGFKKIENVKVGDTIWTGFSWQKVTQTFDEGLKPGLKVHTENGMESTGTPIHRYWCLRNGEEQWIAGKDLNPETDLICVNVNTGFKKSTVKDKEKYEIGYFLGLLTGDGGCSLIDEYGKFSLTTKDLYIKEFIYYFAQKYLENSHICYGESNLSYTIANKRAVKIISDWGIKTSYSWEKEIPSFAWENIDAMKGFIAGVFDTDGCWDKKGDCFFEMTAGKLLDQIQIALSALGIESRVRHNTKLYGMQKHLVSRLTIGQCEAAKFEKLGICFKAQKARGHIPAAIPNCKDTIPLSQVKELIELGNKKTDKGIRNRKHKKPTIRVYYPKITYDKLDKLIAWLDESREHGLLSEEEIFIVEKYRKIFLNKWKTFKVEEVGNQYFYDLTVENEHSYWSNGLISHNTVSTAILETLLLLHFQLDIGHAAATEDQSATGLGYIDGFINTIEPLMLAAGWANITQNKRKFQFKTPQNKKPFIKIVICTPKGMNSLHANVLFLDELDLADPAALKEGKYIVSYSKGINGVKVYLSTRKYAFGNMTHAIDQAPTMNYKILNWNIIDVTERCPEIRHLPNGPKEDIYVAKNLPLQRVSSTEHELLPEIEKLKWDLIKDANEGCVKCPILPVCKMRLAQKPATATGGFYKPITSVIQSFLENDPDSAEAQLMCFSDGTQILMEDGTSKNIKDVTIGDIVISHTGSARKVTKTFKRMSNGNAFKVKNTNWKHFDDTIVTSEHPYFLNGKEFKSIGESTPFAFDKWGSLKQKGDYLSLPVSYQENKMTEIRYEDFVSMPLKTLNNTVKPKQSRGRYIPSQFTLNEEFGWILGYFLAEGFIIKSKKYVTAFSGITFCSHERETEYHERVRKFAKLLNLTTSEHKNKNGHGFTIDIYNNAVAELFSQLCGQYSDKKKIHAVLMNANIKFLKGILEGFYAGDGTKRKKPYKELTTTSYALASQLFTIAARLGWCPRITRKPNLKNRKRAYLVHYIDIDHKHIQNRTRFLVENNYNQYRLDELEPAKYFGEVYNFEVEIDHSYIANGVAVHNCWKPGSTGLVYPRFNPAKGNVISLKEAFESFFGPTNKPVTELTLLHEMQKAGILFYAGVDWGYSHDFVITIVAAIPNGDIWLMETYASPGMEFADQLEVAKSFREKYRIHKWYADTSMPSHIKSFRKNGMPCPKFTKDVLGGIEAVRSKIVSANGTRKFKVIANESNKKAIAAITKHRFILDGQGNVTMNPDDARGIADICDTLRYIGQNMFPVRGTQKVENVWIDVHGQPIDKNDPQARIKAEFASRHDAQMRTEIAKILGTGGAVSGGTGKKGGFFYNF